MMYFLAYISSHQLKLTTPQLLSPCFMFWPIRHLFEVVVVMVVFVVMVVAATKDDTLNARATSRLATYMTIVINCIDDLIALPTLFIHIKWTHQKGPPLKTLY